MLQVVLGKYVEATIIAGLLVFNAVLGLFQESRAQATLAALKSRLELSTSVRRDGTWAVIPAAALVPGDVVKLSLGGVAAADMRLTAGDVLLDQSMLTGESVPIEAGTGFQTVAGTLVRRGEALAEVTATGAPKFGPHRGTRPYRPGRELRAEGSSARGAQSRGVQRRRYRDAGGLCLLSEDAACRDCPSRTDGGLLIIFCPSC